MQISVVIPSCNRKARLLSLLQHLDQSTYPIYEVIVVDSGEDKLSPHDYAFFKTVKVHYLQSEKSVCIQRNIGIQKAASDWIFLCDDDIEIGRDYIDKLVLHINSNPGAGVVSGLWLQKERGDWTAKYPERSALQLIWKFVFQLSIWGEISCTGNNFFLKRIKKYYSKKGNHISRAGWPVITNFDGNFFTTPLYSLGAAIVKKQWLLLSPFDEVLDRHGIGDNYAVIAGFPEKIVHVVNSAPVYHHHEMENRLQKPLQYYRRALALDYFIKTKQQLKKIKKRWLLWSLMGNLIQFIVAGKKFMIRAAVKSIWKIAIGQNPYYAAAKQSKKVEEIFL
jgi:glycosyltransferase involved in cell wall biosynthesis